MTNAQKRKFLEQVRELVLTGLVKVEDANAICRILNEAIDRALRNQEEEDGT